MDIFSKLGINFHSILVYVVNFGILVALIAYFLTGPILKMIDDRRKKIEDNLNEAENIKAEFVKEKEKQHTEKELLKSEMEKELADLKKDMDEKRRTQEEAIEAKKSRMMEEINKFVDEEKQNIVKNAEKQVLELIEKVVLHVVSNKIPKKDVQESVQEAWSSFNK